MQSIVKLVAITALAFHMLPTQALSPEAIEGKQLYPSCDVCHNPEHNPPLGPPMWGVQRLYKRNSLDQEDFVDAMVAFVKAPSLDKAIHTEAIKQLGLMPALPLPDQMLKKIALYIYEELFSPPCHHWQIAQQRAEKRGDLEHARKDANMYRRFCE